jgi:hypothetical protein
MELVPSTLTMKRVSNIRMHDAWYAQAMQQAICTLKVLYYSQS